MIQHISIEEIRQLEENARNLRSEAIFETCASLFKAIGSGIIGLAANVGKTYGRVQSTALGARTR